MACHQAQTGGIFKTDFPPRREARPLSQPFGGTFRDSLTIRNAIVDFADHRLSSEEKFRADPSDDGARPLGR